VRQKVELIEIAVWLILAGFGLLTAVLASGCANPNADKGWLSRQNHQWNYRYHPLTVKWDRKLFEYQNDSVELALEMYPCEMLQEHEGDENPPIRPLVFQVWYVHKGKELVKDFHVVQ